LAWFLSGHDEHAFSEELDSILKKVRRGRAFAAQLYSKEIYLDGYRQVIRVARTMSPPEKKCGF
jgi:hypothetical protein